MLRHVFLVLAVLWLLASRGWCHPLAYFVSFFYLYLVNERYALRLWRRLLHEEKCNVNELKLFADFESVRWLNNAIAKAWPIFMEQIASQQILLPMIPWFLDRYKPWTAREAALQHLCLGRKPPEINKVKVVTQSNGHDHLVLELGMSFLCGDDMSAIFTVKLRKRLGLGIRAKMHVTNMHIEGKVLVGVKFLQDWPYLGLVRLSFIEPPYFQMTAKPIFHHGLDVTELPGIAGWLDKIFSLAFQQTLVQPNMLVLDVKKLVFNKAESWFTVHGKTPIAFAEVEILEGMDLKPSVLNDLYVNGHLGHYRFRTKVQRKTASPKWFEEFLVPITSWDEPNILVLEVCHKVHTSFQIHGNCEVDISNLRGGHKHGLWLSLENTKVGRLHLAIKILEEEHLMSDGVDGDAMIEEATEIAAFPETEAKGELAKPSKPMEGLSRMSERSEGVNIEEWKSSIHVHNSADNSSEWESPRMRVRTQQAHTHPFHNRGSEESTSPNLTSPTSQHNYSGGGEEKPDGKRARGIAKLKKGIKIVGATLHRSPKDGNSTENDSTPHSSFHSANENSMHSVG